MFKRKPLWLATATALGVASLGSVFATSALAQDQDQDADEELLVEEVVVTGSRIARADIDGASPVTVIDRESMQVTGLTDVGDLLQSMPSMSGSPIGTTTNNGGNGSVQIDLRGMGVNRTVTLVNGQRTVDGGDYQTIPSTMIERVEILKDGASAVYGADAVAGVVNIITRKDFEGVEVSAQYADFFDMDSGAQGTIGMIAGTNFDSGNVVFGLEFVDQEEAYQADAPWDFFLDSFYIYPEGCENNLTAPYPEGCYRIGSSRIPESRLRFANQGLFLIGDPASQPYEVGLMIPHDGRNYNYAPVNYIQTPYERTNLFSEGHFDLTDNVRFNFEIRGNYRTSAQELAPQPYTDSDPQHDGFWTDPATGETISYHGISPDNYYLRRAVDLYNQTNNESLAYEPITQLRRRMIERKRRFTQEIHQYQFIAGLEGSFGDSYDWDVFVNQGYRDRSDVDTQYDGTALFNALGPSADLDGDGVPECYQDINDPATLLQGCVPLNMFGGGTVVRETGETVVSTLTEDMIDYIAVDLIDNFQTKQTLAGASLTGNNFELPGGALGWAVGYQYWKQEFSYRPDSAKVTGNATGNVGAGTEGTLKNDAIYAEVLAPVLDSVYLKGGLRYDEYDAFDGDWTWQLGVEWNVLENLKVRGTAGTVFRAPTIGELYGGVVDSFPTYVDPCAQGDPLPPGCSGPGVQLDNQVKAAVGGNPNLEPEKGDTYTVGLVWTPQFGDHAFTATVDYWQIELEDAISSLGVQYTLDSCYNDLNQQACDLITRNSDGQIVLVQDTNLNVAEQGGKGVDTELRWNYQSSIGDWQGAILWAHLMERTKRANPNVDTIDLSGRYTDPTAADGGAYATDKVNATLQWMMGDLSVGWLMEYISSIDADTFCNCGEGNQPDGSYIQKIDSFLYHDLVASYTFGFNTTISAGVTNVTDEAPPFIEVGFNAGTDPATYRLFGRGYYVRATWKF
jgi:outer membrane receptor protein involved in Fe transport